MAGISLSQFDQSEFEPAFDDADSIDSELTKTERAQAGNRAYAHKLVDYWLNQKSTINHWPRLEKKRISRGMHARIVNPNLIKQRGTGLCGPAAFLRALARQDPCEFALFGGLLYARGFANLGRHGRVLKRIEPRFGTKASPVPPDMDHTDWLLLASLRDGYNDVFTYRWDGFNQLMGMTVQSMAEFFRGAGYSHVVERLGGTAIFQGMVSKGVENIEQANRHFNQSYQVCLLVDSQMLDTAEPGISSSANHWIGLCSPIEVNRMWQAWSRNEISRIGVKIPKVFSWGESKKRNMPAYRCIPPLDYMSLNNFIRCYYGFVAAKP